MNHLLLYCPYTKELWFRLLNPVGSGNLVPTDQLLFVDWWTRLRKSVAKDLRKGGRCLCSPNSLGYLEGKEPEDLPSYVVFY